DAREQLLGGGFQHDPVVGVDDREILESGAPRRVLRRQSFDGVRLDHLQPAVAADSLAGEKHSWAQVIAVDDMPRHVGVVALGEEVVFRIAESPVAAVIDVQDAFDRLRRLMPRLLLRPLLLLLPVLLRRPVLLLRRLLLLLWSAFRRLWHRLGAGLRVRCYRLRLCGRCVAGNLLPRALLASVVLDVDDATLRVERRRNLVLAMTLAPAAATAAAVSPEAAPSAAATTLAFLVLRVLSAAVAVHALLLRITGVARLGRIGGSRLRGIRWCGGTLSFSIHLVSSVATSSAGG